MPARPSHLPTVHERNILQKLKGREVPGIGLGSPKTIERLLTKGWIKRGNSGHFTISVLGEAAMRAELPINH